MISVDYLMENLRLDPDGRIFWTKPKKRRTVGKEAGRPHNQGYRYVCIGGKNYLSHRIVFAMANGRWPESDIDHINGNRTDNRPCNLREATRSQNMMNRVASPKTGMKGVCFDKWSGKWKVSVSIAGRKTYQARFSDLELADLVAQEARRKFHGEFARDA